MLHRTRQFNRCVIGGAAVVAAAAICGVAGGHSPASATAARTSTRITGFTPRHSAWESRFEGAFGAQLTPQRAKAYTYGLTRYPGLLATKGDRRRVRYVMGVLRRDGLRPQVKTYYTYVSEPRKVSVTMTAPFRFHAANKEPRQPGEKDYAKMVVGYNALSPSGNVTAPAVYVNYGRPSDYAQLAKMGVSVKGKIAISRYGQNFRGVKVSEAQRHGAVGSIIYSDPQQDGYRKGKVFPNGPWRAATGIQRGSVQYLWKYGGDPLTPGNPATKGARRVSPAHAASLPRIPSTPISYGSAKPILSHLGGKVAPKAWQGGLPFTYTVGGGQAKIHLDLNIKYQVKPIWDVLVHIRGTTHPGQQVMVGAHRDAWTYGSDDNGSGAVNVLQIAHALGHLQRTGWRPDRSITLALWDGEEYGMYGSTEYAEQQGSRLDKTVAYLNMDIAAGKDFSASAVPSLDNLIKQVSRNVSWPGYRNLFAAWSARSHGKPAVDRPGSGSDYTAPLDRYGVPAADIGGSTPSGDYHCSCDNVYMENHFIDPTWRYHVGVTQEIGTVMLRLADANVPALDYANYAGAVQGYLKALRKTERTTYGRQVLNLAPALRAARTWGRAATRLTGRTEGQLARGASSGSRAATTSLLADERDLVTQRGLPGRPWYRHQVYAPGQTTGYAVEYLPAITDALTSHRPALARTYLSSLVTSLRRAATTLRGG